MNWTVNEDPIMKGLNLCNSKVGQSSGKEAISAFLEKRDGGIDPGHREENAEAGGAEDIRERVS